jgi:hypothetical protein
MPRADWSPQNRITVRNGIVARGDWIVVIRRGKDRNGRPCIRERNVGRVRAIAGGLLSATTLSGRSFIAAPDEAEKIDPVRLVPA